ncbi:exodeoxyribonuclease VII large subunit [Thiomicrolovo sp. ZZH C-3]
MNPPATVTLEQFQEKVNSLLQSNVDLFRGMLITDVSIPGTLECNGKPFFQGSTREEGIIRGISFYIPCDVIQRFLQAYPEHQGDAKFDVRIKDVRINRYNTTIQITVDELRETGVSNRELLKRRLDAYCRANGVYERPKRPLPPLVLRVLALTSRSSTIQTDIGENIGLTNPNAVEIAFCESSEAIAGAIGAADPDRHDLVVLYRGGREDDAMDMFSEESIIAAIAAAKLPVAVALGHEVDRPFIYNVADVCADTPSAFAKMIHTHNLQRRDEYFHLLKSIGESNRFFAAGARHRLDARQKGVENNSHTCGAREYDRLRTAARFFEQLPELSASLQHRLERRGITIKSELLALAAASRSRLSSRDDRIGAHLRTTRDAFKNKVRGKMDQIQANVAAILTRRQNVLQMIERNLQGHQDAIVQHKRAVLNVAGAAVTSGVVLLRHQAETHIDALSREINATAAALDMKAKAETERQQERKRNLLLAAGAVLVILALAGAVVYLLLMRG